MNETTLLSWISRALFAPILAVAAAILVRGYAETGGGFAAGVIAGLGVLLHLIGMGSRATARRIPWIRRADLLMFGGLLLMTVVAFLPLSWGSAAVSHLPEPGEALRRFGSLEIHTAVLFELGMALLTLGFIVAVLDRLMRDAP